MRIWRAFGVDTWRPPELHPLRDARRPNGAHRGGRSGRRQACTHTSRAAARRARRCGPGRRRSPTRSRHGRRRHVDGRVRQRCARRWQRRRHAGRRCRQRHLCAGPRRWRRPDRRGRCDRRQHRHRLVRPRHRRRSAVVPPGGQRPGGQRHRRPDQFTVDNWYLGGSTTSSSSRPATARCCSTARCRTWSRRWRRSRHRRPGRRRCPAGDQSSLTPAIAANWN